MRDDPLPGSVDFILWIFRGTQPHGGHRAALRGVRELLAPAVPPLADGARGIGADAVVCRDKLRIPEGQACFLLRGQVCLHIAEDLISWCAEDI